MDNQAVFLEIFETPKEKHHGGGDSYPAFNNNILILKK